MHVEADNVEEAHALMRAAIARGLEEMGLAAEGYAKVGRPVGTGRLRNSITHVRASETTEAIGTNVEYGRYVEFREDVSHEKGHAHFLRDAAAGHTAEYVQILRSALRG